MEIEVANLDNERALLAIEYVGEPSAGSAGDYNGSGLVEQADLDMVLLNWGADAASVPGTWINDLPTGIVDQAELDGVLLNWGDTVSAAESEAVPEPAGLAVAIAAIGGCWLLAPRRARRTAVATCC